MFKHMVIPFDCNSLHEDRIENIVKNLFLKIKF